MEDINVVIAGAAGEGVQTVGEILARVISAQGYGVFTWKEYESRIRGGQNSYRIRISEKPRNAPLSKADVLLALNEGALNKYERLLKEKSTLLAKEKVREGMIAIDFQKIAREEVGDRIFANTIAVGALTAILGLDLDVLSKVLNRAFSDKGKDVLENNHKAAKTGFELADKECRDLCPYELPGIKGNYHIITANDSIPLAAAYAGCRFMAAYPMTPSTGIISFFGKEQERLGVFIEQAEDEISAINMAIGASYGGARAMTATSGGGFALMVEGISLAGMTETPLVMVLAQRPGPATGLPTRTSQGDLLFAINAGHGEFPKMVLAPSDPEDAFYLTIRAFNVADKYQIPVIIMTDQFLADSHFSVPEFDFDRVTPEFFMADPSELKEYKRYALNEGGISPRLFPGQSKYLVCADSDEHDEQGHITEDLEGVAVPMAEKRVKKFHALQREIDPPEEKVPDNADVIFVSWGSSRGAVLEAVERLKNDGINAGMIHFTTLWPLPEYEFPEGTDIVTIESNITGQLARLLRSEYGVSFKDNISRYDGLPITGEHIRRRFNEKHE
jgi:2-oxoglutarate ferredoxin oxidoreductase subunit alpha